MAKNKNDKKRFKVIETHNNLRLLRDGKEVLWSVPKYDGPSDTDRKIFDRIKELFEKANNK